MQKLWQEVGIEMVKGCNRCLDVDFVWVEGGRIEETFYENGTHYSRLRCGMKNVPTIEGSKKVRIPENDILLCRECAIRQGYLW